MTAEIGYPLSPTALAYVAEERRQTMVRDPRRTCSRHELERLLGQHGLPASAAVLDFEANLGGWSSSNPPSHHGFGIYLSLQEGPECSRVADKFRRKVELFSGQRDQPIVDDEWSPLWGTGYPRAFFLDRPLIPAGMTGEDVVFFLGQAGEVYSLITVMMELYLLAGNGRTLLETLALAHHKGNQMWFELHICGDVSALLAERLQVPRYAPACDPFFEWWANDTVQIRLVPDQAPCISGTHLACKNESDFLGAVRWLQGHLDVQRLRIWERANNLVDDAGRHALVMNEIDAEILRGAGPGNYELAYDEEREENYVRPSQYQSALCDLKSWSAT